MIRLVLDTNILVLFLIASLGKEATLIRSMEAGVAASLYSAPMMLEYETVPSRPKFGFAQAEVARVLGLPASRGTSVAVQPSRSRSPDPSDTKFIDCAIAAQADFLVTGNRRHGPEPRYGTALVVNPATLLDHLAGKPPTP